jgi:hypothetical protein
MFRFAFQLSPKLCVIKPKLGSACLILPSADGRQIWFWGEGGKSAHSFVAVCFHTFYASLAFSQCIHRSNYPISMEWRIDSYSGKNSNAFSTFPSYHHLQQQSVTSAWMASLCSGTEGHSLSMNTCWYSQSMADGMPHWKQPPTQGGGLHVRGGTHLWIQNCMGSKTTWRNHLRDI